MLFEKFISKLFSSDSFLIINLKGHITITNKIIDINERFFDFNILLSLYSHRLKTNDILSLNISKTISYLFIYDFLRIKSYYLN